MIFRRWPRHGVLNGIARAVERLILGNPDHLRARLPRLAIELERVDRFARVDFRQNLARTLTAQLSRTDLVSGRVGKRVPRFRDARGVVRDFAGLPRAIGAEWALHSERTESRTLACLRRAGVVAGPGKTGAIIKQPREREGRGPWKAFAAIRRVDLDVLAAAVNMVPVLALIRGQRSRGADAIRVERAAQASADRLAFASAVAALAAGATFDPAPS